MQGEFPLGLGTFPCWPGNDPASAMEVLPGERVGVSTRGGRLGPGLHSGEEGEVRASVPGLLRGRPEHKMWVDFSKKRVCLCSCVDRYPDGSGNETNTSCVDRTGTGTQMGLGTRLTQVVLDCVHMLLCFSSQYVPAKNERVLGIVTRTGRHHRVDIGSAVSAVLPELAFEGATKRTKPALQVCSIEYCVLSL